MALVGHWPLNKTESTGLVAADVVGSNNGTLTNMAGTEYVSGRDGHAIEFDGINDQVVVGDALDGMTDLTISVWVKLNATGLQHLVDKYGSPTTSASYLLRVETGGVLAFLLSNTGAHQGSTYYLTTAAGTLDTGSWTHIVAVSESGSTMRVYVNGVVNPTTKAAPASLFAGTEPLRFGARSDSVGPLNGKMDEIRIYNNAMSDSEVETLYKSYHPTLSPAPVFRTLVYDQAGTTATDGIGLNHGTLTNMAGTEWSTGKVGTGLTFDGVNDSVNLGNIHNFERTDTFSFSCWFKADTVTGGGSLIAKDPGTARGYDFYIGGDYSLIFILSNAGSSNGILVKPNGFTYSLGVWYHAVVTYDGSSTAGGVTFYINGQSYSNSVFWNTLSATTLNSSPLSIGSKSGSAPFMDGVINDVRIYDVELTAEQNTAIYNEGHLALHAKLDETSGYLASSDGNYSVDGVTVNTDDTEWTPAKIDGGFKHDAVSKHVAFGHSESINFERTDKFSYCMWVKAVYSLKGTTYFCVKRDGNTGMNFDVELNGQRLIFYLLNAVPGNYLAAYYDVNLQDDTWYHLGVTYSGNSNVSGVKFYVNGVQYTPLSGNNSLSSSIKNNVPLLLGRHNVHTPDGVTDDFRVYNKELTAAEVQDIMMERFASVEAGKVLHIPFNETYGTVARDISGNDRDGTLANMTGSEWNPAGISNGSLAWDGINDEVNVPHSSGITPSNLTITAWVKRDGAQDGNRIVDKTASSRGYQLNFYSDDQLIFAPYTNAWRNIIGSGIIADQTWTHVAVTYDGSDSYDAKLYMNGNLDGSGNLFAPINHSSLQLAIGNNPEAYARPYKGEISDVRIYNVVKSQSEINNIMEESALVFHTKLDETSGLIAEDETDTSAHGDLINMTGTEWTTEGAIDGALVFDGINDHIRLSEDITPGDNFSVFGWVKAPATGIEKVLASHFDTTASQRSWYIAKDGVSESDKFAVVLSDDGTFGVGHRKLWVSSISAYDDVWHHIGFTWNAGTLKMYVDGVEDTTPTKTYDEAITTLHNSTADITIGCSLQSDVAARFLEGTVDDIRIYHLTLNDTQISTLHAMGPAPPSPGGGGIAELRRRRINVFSQFGG